LLEEKRSPKKKLNSNLMYQVVLYLSLCPLEEEKPRGKKGTTKARRQQAYCNRRHVLMFLVVVFFIVNNYY
jgi:hypothetical protein